MTSVVRRRHVLVCEKRTTWREKDLEVCNPSQFHVLTLGVLTGAITQDIPVFDSPKEKTRFEDIDDSGLLIRDSDRFLPFFARSRDGARA